MIVQSDPVDPSCADALDEWLTTEHIPDVLKVPGFVSTRRFRASEAVLTADKPRPARRVRHDSELESEGSPGRLPRIIADDLIAALTSAAQLSPRTSNCR